LLHISYRLEIKNGKHRGKNKSYETRKAIQELFKNEKKWVFFWSTKLSLVEAGRQTKEI
jgi:hypothetical protein